MGWMPRAISWLRTIVLVAIAVVTGWILIGLDKYPQLINFATRIPSLFLLVLAVVIFIPCILYAYIHCWLLGNKPNGWSKNIPSPKSIKESLLTYVATYFGLLITLVITSPFAPNINRVGQYAEDLQRYYFGVSFSWFVITLYMFHGYDLITNPPQKTVDKAKSEPANNKVNSVDRDLINLKNKTGIHFKEPPKQ